MDRAWLWTIVASVAVMAFLQEHVISDGNVVDECGVCGGPGAVYECGCEDIPEGECDCDGNVLNECGECVEEGRVEIVMAAPMRWRATTIWMPCWTTALAITAAVLAKRKRLCHSHCMWRRRLRCCQA